MDLNLKNINLKEMKDLSLDKGSLLVYYKRYKDFVLPVGVIAAAVLILIFVLIPQLGQYFSSKGELDTESQKLTVLKNNYNFLTNLDETKTDSDLNTLTKVLPTGKDFVGIITAISAVSSKIGVSIGDFSFVVGNLSKDDSSGVATPAIKLNLTLEASPLLVSKFITELYKTAPLANVVSVKIGTDHSTVEAVFYYKPFPPENISDDSPVVQLSSKETSIVNDFSSWNNINQTDNVIPGVLLPVNSSGSADLGAPKVTPSSASPF